LDALSDVVGDTTGGADPVESRRKMPARGTPLAHRAVRIERRKRRARHGRDRGAAEDSEEDEGEENEPAFRSARSREP